MPPKNLLDKAKGGGISKSLSSSNNSIKKRKNNSGHKAIAKAQEIMYNKIKKRALQTTKENPEFDFNPNNNSSSSSNGVIDLANQKKYRFKNQENNHNNSVSIWRIISKRYYTTALNDLFGDSHFNEK